MGTFWERNNGTELSSALFTNDLIYRLYMRRTWDHTLPSATFIMLNPSKDGAVMRDRTTDKCGRYARRWGCGSFLVVNVSPFVSTDPRGMLKHAHDMSVMKENEAWIKFAASDTLCPRNVNGLVVCAWGNNIKSAPRDIIDIIFEAGCKPMCLAITKQGHPSHPLYLKESLKPIPYWGF